MENDLLTSILQRMIAQITGNVSVIITVLVIILIGWGVARLLAGLVRRGVKRMGLNQVFENSGFAQELAKIQPGRTLADLASSMTFWLLWLYIIFAAVTGSGLSMEATPLAAILLFLPRLFAAFLILVGGVLLAQFIGRWVQVGVAATGAEFHEVLGKGARLLLIAISIIIAIEELGINLAPLTNALTNIITIIVAGLALAFGLGARDVVRNILAGYYAREHFSLGDQVQIDGETGTLDAIGTVSSEVALPAGHVVIPNSHLTDRAVRINAENDNEST